MRQRNRVGMPDEFGLSVAGEGRLTNKGKISAFCQKDHAQRPLSSLFESSASSSTSSSIEWQAFHALCQTYTHM